MRPAGDDEQELSPVSYNAAFPLEDSALSIHYYLNSGEYFHHVPFPAEFVFVAFTYEPIVYKHTSGFPFPHAQ